MALGNLSGGVGRDWPYARWIGLVKSSKGCRRQSIYRRPSTLRLQRLLHVIGTGAEACRIAKRVQFLNDKCESFFLIVDFGRLPTKD